MIFLSFKAIIIMIYIHIVFKSQIAMRVHYQTNSVILKLRLRLRKNMKYTFSYFVLKLHYLNIQ